PDELPHCTPPELAIRHVAQPSPPWYSRGIRTRIEVRKPLRRAPLFSARLAATLHLLGAIVLTVVGAPAAAVFTVLHGAGNGILTIAKGTLPLVIFGPQGYGRRQGLLMVPARVAQAFAPWLFGLCLDRWGSGALWVSASLGIAAFAALMALPRGTEAARSG